MRHDDEVTKIVTHAGDTTTSVPRTGEASRALWRACRRPRWL
jgi:hypothetical protein